MSTKPPQYSHGELTGLDRTLSTVTRNYTPAADLPALFTAVESASLSALLSRLKHARSQLVKLAKVRSPLPVPHAHWALQLKLVKDELVRRGYQYS